MDFLEYLLTTSTGLTYLLFAFIILFTASLFRLKKIRKYLNGDGQHEISLRRRDVLYKKKEFHVIFSLMMFLGAFLQSCVVHLLYEDAKDLELTLAIEKSEVREIEQTLVPYFTTDDEARVTFLTYVVKQCRSFDYSNECYIEEFSKKENYTSLFSTIPEEMLVRCLATNDCPELLVNVSTKAIDVFKEAEEQEDKEREFNRKAKWEAERPQRMEAEIGAMKILLEENQAEIKKLREELAKKSS